MSFALVFSRSEQTRCGLFWKLGSIWRMFSKPLPSTLSRWELSWTWSL